MKILFVMLTGVLLFGVAGCSQNTSGLSLAIDELNTESKVKVDNQSLANKLTLEQVKTKRVNGLLVVQANVTSKKSGDQKLQYKFYWFDSSGFEVERDKEPWRPLQLHGSQQVTVQGIAPLSSVEKADLYIREAVEK